MSNNHNNPLLAIAEKKHKDQVNTGSYPFLQNSDSSENTYTLGFSDGVYYCASIFQEQIIDLQNKMKELTESS